jgi:hypothetical protein
MNIVLRRWRVSTLVLLLTALCACLVPGGGYVSGVYEPSGYDYGGWGPGYYVGPARRGERRAEAPSPHAYRPAPRSRPAPPIPTRPHVR